MCEVFMQNILLAPTATAQWQQLISDAAGESKVKLNEEMESYLVFLLMRFLKDSQLGKSVLCMDYLNALAEKSNTKQEKLRDVADNCLLVSGFYPQIAEKRNVNISYFVNLGKTAYLDLSDSISHIGSDLYKQVSQCFVQLMDVLLTIRSYTTEPVLKPIQAYDLWNESQSHVAYKLIKPSF
jgi:hypothetical protein